MSSDAEAPAPGRAAGAARPGGKPSQGASAPSGKPADVLRKLGRYDIERKLGAGGMGAVYLARDTKLRRQVALKVLPQDKANNPVLVRRFEAEAQAAAQLRHDNIVAVYDSGKVEGFLYIAMEYVDGIDLHELVARRGPVPVKRSIEIVKQAASALQHASEHKIVHRDIKPSNLLIRRDGVVKITDLGLARSVDDTIETGITRAGTTVGTVDYMAPEQARSSKAADIRSDIYSLGCTWYHMLTGQPPYPEGSLTNKLQAHALKPLPDPRAVNPQVTDALVAILHRMMAKKPDDRYQTPAELLKDLESSTLTHAAFSQEIFQAIEEEEQAEAAAVASSTSSRPRPTADREEESESAEALPPAETKAAKRREGPTTLPPPVRRQPVTKDEESQAGFNAEKFKLVLIVAGLVLAVVGLGWLMSGLGGVFDSAGPQVGPVPVNPAVPNDVGPPVVTGGVGPTELTNSGPTVAPVYGTPVGTPTEIGTTPGSTLTSRDIGGLPPLGSTGVGTTGGAPGTATTPAPAIRLPDDLTQPPPADDRSMDGGEKLPVWTVGAGTPSATHFATLNEALSKTVDRPAMIRLIGRGPFMLTHTTPLRTPRLQVVGDSQSVSLIVLSPGAEGSPGRLHVQGDLSLENVHLVIDRQGSAVRDPVSMVTVEGGSLSLRSCSLTALHTGAAPLTAIQVRAAQNVPRVVLDEAVIRGEFNIGLDLMAPSVDALVQDSLIAVGAGSAVRLDGSGAANSRAAPVRLIRGFHSTLVCRSSLIDLTADADLDPVPPTHIAMIDTVSSTGDQEGPKVLLNASGWLRARLQETVAWTNSNSSFLGFDTLIDLGDSTISRATDAEGWKAFWRKRVESTEFVDVKWPQQLGALASADPASFGRDQIPAAIRLTGPRGVMPGAPGDRLNVPEALHPERIAALAKRSGFVAPQWNTAAPVRVELRKTDLGVFLSKGEWTDRSVIEAVGYGICTMQPVSLSGRHVKIVFRQEGTAPLRVLVKESSRQSTGLFDIRDGTLELEGLRWQVLDVKPSVPKWLVSATDSRVVFRDCELQGPEAATPPFEGIVRFETTAAAERRDAPQLGIFDSFLHAPGTLIRAEASDGGVFLHNCVLAARGVAIESRPRPIGDRLPLSFDVSHCTFSAQNTVVRVLAATSLPMPPSAPSRWFVDDCVFAPPIELRAGDASTPTLLTEVGAVLAGKQLEWWGRGNGASPVLKYWMRADGSLPDLDRADFTAWRNQWGDAHELQALTSEGGVLLRAPLPNRRDQILPASFLLRTTCQAMMWADGRPIGAVLGMVGPKPAPKDAPATPGKAAPKTPGSLKPKPGSGIKF